MQARGLGHHGGVGVRRAGYAAGPVAGPAGGRTRRHLPRRRATLHALGGRERVVARPGGAGARGARCWGCRRPRRCRRSLGTRRLGRRLGNGCRGRSGCRRLGSRRGWGHRRSRSRLGDLGGSRRCWRGSSRWNVRRRTVGGRGGLLGRRLLRGLLGRLGLGGLTPGVAVLLVQPPDHRGLDGGGRRLDELPHVLECRKDFLAGDSELLREFMDSGFSHVSPSQGGPRPAKAADRQLTGMLIGEFSSRGHEPLLRFRWYVGLLLIEPTLCIVRLQPSPQG